MFPIITHIFASLRDAGPALSDSEQNKEPGKRFSGVSGMKSKKRSAEMRVFKADPQLTSVNSLVEGEGIKAFLFEAFGVKGAVQFSVHKQLSSQRPLLWFLPAARTPEPSFKHSMK